MRQLFGKVHLYLMVVTSVNSGRYHHRDRGHDVHA